MGWMDCEYCGDSLREGAYTAPWEDDDNAYGYVICPHCKRKNVRYTDDD